MGDNVRPYVAVWNKVHMATVRGGLWSPACSDEQGWVAPLADPILAGQITCKVCHPLAMAANGSTPRTQPCCDLPASQHPEGCAEEPA